MKIYNDFSLSFTYCNNSISFCAEDEDLFEEYICFAAGWREADKRTPDCTRPSIIIGPFFLIFVYHNLKNRKNTSYWLYKLYDNDLNSTCSKSYECLKNVL